MAVSCEQKPATTSESQDQSASEQFADSVLSTLDLTDKVGEMTQLTLDMLCVGQPYALEEPHRLDTAKLKMAIADLRVGSILNCGGHSYPREFWFETISAIQEVAMNQKESGIPVLYGIDAIHGTNYTDNSTLFPQQIGLAATFNPSLAFEMGRITAYETRASGIPWTFSPVLDIARDPRWPRVWETFGEDPHLLTVMGEELVKGYQGDDVADSTSVAACLKHFLGYSTPLSGKDRTQAWIPERQLREYFLPGFQKAIDAGAKTIMINSESRFMSTRSFSPTFCGMNWVLKVL
jgi:beta-glucosidase